VGDACRRPKAALESWEPRAWPFRPVFAKKGRRTAVYYKHVADDDVRFDWDQANDEHIARHSFKPDEAEQAIRNDPLDMNYEVIDGEERWTPLGHTDEYRVLLLVWTLRTDALRIVTARAVGRKARDAYLRAKGLLT